MGLLNKNPGGWLDYLLYLLLRTVSTMLHCLPLEAVMRLAAFLGDVFYLVDGRHRRRSMENLRASFPQMNEQGLRKTTRDSFRLLPLLGVEIMMTPRYVKLQRLANLFELGNVSDILRLMVKRESAIFVTGHYGNWEVLGYAMAVMGFETSSVARPIDNPYINKFLLEVREKRGQRIIDKRGALREAPAVLDKHGAIAFIADQDAGPKGMFVDFFGRPASTYKSIGVLALRYDVPIVIGFARRVAYGFRFRIDVQDIIRPADWAAERDPLRYITQRYTRAIEDTVRGDPGQYLWLHRRWKSRPRETTASTALPAVQPTGAKPANASGADVAA